MKKKTLLLTLLALAIITSLTAGTLAVYTKQVDLKADVQIKKFAFEAEGQVDSGTQVINLAPTETMTYSFKVMNFTNDKRPAEVNLDYTIHADFSNATELMPGLIGELIDQNKKVVDQTKNGKLKYNFALPENEATVHDYVLKLTWAGNDNAAQSKFGEKKPKTDGLTITVNAVQQLKNTFAPT